MSKNTFSTKQTIKSFTHAICKMDGWRLGFVERGKISCFCFKLGDSFSFYGWFFFWVNDQAWQIRSCQRKKWDFRVRLRAFFRTMIIFPRVSSLIYLIVIWRFNGAIAEKLQANRYRWPPINWYYKIVIMRPSSCEIFWYCGDIRSGLPASWDGNIT